MGKLKIIRKSNGKVFQIIDLAKMEEPTENVMTIIFCNVEVVNSEEQIIRLSRNVGNDQSILLIEWHARLRHFECANTQRN